MLVLARKTIMHWLVEFHMYEYELVLEKKCKQNYSRKKKQQWMRLLITTKTQKTKSTNIRLTHERTQKSTCATDIIQNKYPSFLGAESQELIQYDDNCVLHHLTVDPD